MMGEENPGDDQDGEGNQLQDGEDVLGDRAGFDPQVIDGGEKENGADRQRHGGTRAQPEQGDRIVGEGDRHAGNGAGRNDQ
jgi:hypothetical protein